MSGIGPGRMEKLTLLFEKQFYNYLGLVILLGVGTYLADVKVRG